MSDAADTAGARLIEVESKLVFLEQLVDTLNGVIITQQNQIDQLEAIVRRLAESFRDAAQATGRGDSADERPPHY